MKGSIAGPLIRVVAFAIGAFAAPMAGMAFAQQAPRTTLELMAASRQPKARSQQAAASGLSSAIGSRLELRPALAGSFIFE